MEGRYHLMVLICVFAGRDIGANLPILLNSLGAELPSDGSTMLRIGMTNPPYILEHLKEIAEVLRHPCVYSFLHVPVQSGSDTILTVSIEPCFMGYFVVCLIELTTSFFPKLHDFHIFKLLMEVIVLWCHGVVISYI